MHVLLAPHGSLGDAHPYIGLGRILQNRGHDVRFVANGYFRSMAEQAGLGFVESTPAQEYMDFVNNPDKVTSSGAFRLAWEGVIKTLPAVYSSLRDCHVPGETVIAAPGWSMAARCANEKLGVPLVLVQLSPSYLQSIYDDPEVPDWFPRWAMRMLYQFFDRVYARKVAPQVNAVRAELSLPAVDDRSRNWWPAPQAVIGCFPDWFASPQPDWPSNVRLVGFPRHDPAPDVDDSDEVDEFLDAGEPPIVFSHSSHMAHADDYFATSAEIARRMGHRAILLTTHSRQIPTRLPHGVRHFKYVPFSRLLPRALAHVHPGGIGTIAQTLAAEVPQITVPFVYDQPDNSLRLQRLGVSLHMSPSAYRPRFAAKQISRLINSQDTASQCRTYAEICRKTEAFESAADELERIHAQQALVN